MDCRRRRIFERRRGALAALSLSWAIVMVMSCRDVDDKTRGERLEPAFVDPPSAPMADGGVHSDSQVLGVLDALDATEVARSRIAQSKATRDDVKELATMMVTEHTATAQRLKTLGQQKGLSSESSASSESVEEDAESFTTRLEERSGAAFDRAYVESEIMAHVKARSAIDHVLSAVAVDPDLKAVLDEIREAEGTHLERAQAVRRALLTDASATVDASWITEESSSSDAGSRFDAGPRFDAGSRFDAGAH